MSRYFGATMLAMALLQPLSMKAQDHRDDQARNDQSKRYYDSSHKDYHEWNDKENQRYHGYLKENHKRDHDWEKANKREQADYWKWRHEHSDEH